MSGFKKIIFLYIFFVLINLAAAQDSQIKFADIRVENGYFFVHTHLNDFLTDDIQSLIASGMTASLHFYFQLLKGRDDVLQEKEETIFIRNDVWEKKYLIQSTEFSKTITGYDHFKAFLFDSLRFALGTIKNFDRTVKMHLMFSFSPESISSVQKKKLKFWLADNESETQKNTDDDGSSFSINITNLISFFFKENNKMKMDVYKSKPFTIQSVMDNAKTP